MDRRKRRTAWFLALLMLFVTLVCGFEIACEAHHVCVGADCRVCAHITLVRGLLRSVSIAVVLALIPLMRRLMRSVMPKPTRCLRACSPVLLRVKLLN